MSHSNKKPKNELIVIPKSYEEDEELYEKAAEMVLNLSLFNFKKEKLLEQIDQSLVNYDEALFMSLTKQYKELLLENNLFH